MHAWRGHSYGPPESLVFEPVDDPVLSPGQARIAVRAAAVNFPDVLYVGGTYQVKPPPPFVPGFEVAGTVVESLADSLPAGARVVAGMPLGGGYATHAVVAEPSAYRIPDAMSFDEAAGFTITYQTGWFALHRRAHLQPGEWLLVHAGAGGVGSAAIQLGKAAGARVIATAGGPDKVRVCRDLGADVAVDYATDDFVAAVKSATAGRGADVVFDPVGGEVFDRSTKCIAFEGRMVVIGFTSGRFSELKTNHVLVKNYAVVGLHWGLYNLMAPDLVTKAQSDLFALYEQGRIKPLVGARLPLAEAPSAMRLVSSRQSTGKVILTA